MAKQADLDATLKDFDEALKATGVDASTDTEPPELTDERKAELRKKYPALKTRR